MKDYNRKFCRPKTTKHPEVGDVKVKLNCGNTVYIKAKDYLGIKKSFKIDSIVGEVTNTAGNIKVLDKTLNEEIIVSPQTYINNQNKFNFIEVVGNINNSEDGDIICHSTTLNQDAIFSYNDWLNLSDDWNLVGLYGITTYEEEDAANGDYVIMANGHTLIIKPEDYSKVSDNWEQIDTISKGPVYEAIDLGLPSGLKWANMNVGAESEEEDGAYFSWGNIEPHFPTSASSFSPYTWGGSNTGSPYKDTPGASIPFTSQTKNADYSADSGYDAARELFGGSWRMPTATEFKELYDNTDNEWTTINGVNGRKFMKKTDHSVYVFFPAAGYGSNTSLSSRGSVGNYWSSSLYSADNGYYLLSSSSYIVPQSRNYRYYGCSVRAVQ